jgi:hypothetical protein
VKTDAAKIKHVFLIVLEKKDYNDTFGTSTQDPYLQKTHEAHDRAERRRKNQRYQSAVTNFSMLHPFDRV